MTSKTTANTTTRGAAGRRENFVVPPVAGCRPRVRAKVGETKAPGETHILIVDDEVHVRLVLERILSRAGYQCMVAGSASEARALLRSHAHPFDLLLCDLIMPEASGFTLLRHVHEEYPGMAVIIVSGIDDPEVAEPAANAGADGYITKPFNSGTILINVVGALRRRAAHVAATAHAAHLEHGMQAMSDELEVALEARSTELHQALGRPSGGPPGGPS